MENARQPYVVCIGKAELLQDLRFERDTKDIIQANSEWKWESFAGVLARLLGKLGCRTKLVTKAYSDASGQFLKQLLEQSGLDAHLVWEELSSVRAYQGYSEHIHSRVLEKNAPAMPSVTHHGSGLHLRFDEISMTDLQGADLVVIASPFEAKPEQSSQGLEALRFSIRDWVWNRLTNTMSTASHISQQGIPVLCMIDHPILGKEGSPDECVELMLSHLQHVKFLWLNEYPIFKRSLALTKLLQKHKAEYPCVFFPEMIEDQTQPAPPMAEQGSSCCLRRSYKRFMGFYASAQESSVLLDSKLKPDEQDLLFLGGFIASHLKGSSIKDSMGEGARLAQDAKMLAALTSTS